jgi:hypothetical protein
MHTLLVTSAGLAVLLVFGLIAQRRQRQSLGSGADAMRAFIWVWLVASLANLMMGVFVAGVSFTIELGVFVIVFGVPAAIAWLLGRRAKAQAIAARASS